MTERRVIEAALKSLYSEDGADTPEVDDPSPQRSKRDSPNRSASPRHDRRCCVCRHRERAEIESEFLRWRSAQSIAKEYGIAHHSSIYRHAHATGLFAQRATHLRLALSPLIEQAAVVHVTADSIVRAVALCARLTDDGEWIVPPKHVIYHSSKADESRPFPKARRRKQPQQSSAHPPRPGDLDREARQPLDFSGSFQTRPASSIPANPNSENAPSTT
jgi:hypothetical protein